MARRIIAFAVVGIISVCARHAAAEDGLFSRTAVDETVNDPFSPKMVKVREHFEEVTIGAVTTDKREVVQIRVGALLFETPTLTFKDGKYQMKIRAADGMLHCTFNGRATSQKTVRLFLPGPKTATIDPPSIKEIRESFEKSN
jgi:hypothetical protein